MYLYALTLLKGDSALPVALAALAPVLSTHTRVVELLHAAELAALQAIEARYITPDLLKKAYHRELSDCASSSPPDYARALDARIDKIKPADREEWKEVARQLQDASDRVKMAEGLAHGLCREVHVCLGNTKVSFVHLHLS